MSSAIAVQIVDGVAGESYETPAAKLNSGIYHKFTADLTDQVIAIPANATSVVLWFAASETDDTPVTGRFIINASATAETGVTATGTKFAHHPPLVVQHMLPSTATHLHVMGKTGVVVKGFFAIK